MKYILGITLVLGLLLLQSCATHRMQLNNALTQEFNTDDKTLSHSFYLIGNVGDAPNPSNPVLSGLEAKLKDEGANTTVLFLGDNVPQQGMPLNTDFKDQSVLSNLEAQLSVAKTFEGRTLFIPGDQDWNSTDRIIGLKRQESQIDEQLGDIAFYPENGCPIEQLDITADILLLIIDSQWYLEDWDKNPTINDHCDINSREKFFEELERLIKQNRDKTTLVAMHHPLFSNGPHGGQYGIKQHLVPFNNGVPLPGIGSLLTFIRKTGGVLDQDVQNKTYQEFRRRVVTLAQESNNIIFVSAHEKSLQYIKQDNTPQIISGSGATATVTKNTGNGAFSYGHTGYAKLNVYTDGSSEVNFYSLDSASPKLVYNTTVLAPSRNAQLKNYAPVTGKTKEASVYTTPETETKGFYKFLWGERYRSDYSQKVSAPMVDLDTLFGGLTPVIKGGGHQSNSLTLTNKNGAEYVMVGLRKNALKYIQAIAYKDKYIEGQFDESLAKTQLLDIFTGAHPYAPFAVGTLADAVQIYHANPVLYYVPKQNALKGFNDEFGDQLYMIEERAASKHGNLASFGFSNHLISTDELLSNIRKDTTQYIDEDAYIRARLFDMLIGDWDRREDQWRWATFTDENGSTLYRPVARGRDQAFSIMADGALLDFLTRVIPSLRLLHSYNEDLRNVKWFNKEAYPLDMALLNRASKQDWDKQVAFITARLTDEVIEEAFTHFPKEVDEATLEDIKTKLKGRRKALKSISNRYYKHLQKYIVVKGTDKDDHFSIEALKNGQTHLQVHSIQNGEIGELNLDKIYDKHASKEIWVYGLDGKDVFEVKGKQAIKIILIGGLNEDSFTVENGTRVHIYDHETQTNNYDVDTNTAHIHQTDDYALNAYDYKKLKYIDNRIIPNIESNPDDGLSLGVIDKLTFNGFDRSPFTSQHHLKFNYYFSTHGYNTSYTGEFVNVFKKSSLLVELGVTDSNYADNFFGFGNETSYDRDALKLDYFRVRQSTVESALGFIYRGKNGSKTTIKGVYESYNLEANQNRILVQESGALGLSSKTEATLFDKNSFVGSVMQYEFENYNDNVRPTLGMYFNFETGFKVNLDKINRSILYVKPTLGFIRNITKNHRLSLATKVAAHINFGQQEDLEIYQSARIGGAEGLRGYNNERFTGKHSFYSSSDLRYNFRKLKSGIVPFNLGFFGGFDIGRVWVETDPSKEWHTSTGAGIWVTVAELITGQIGFFNSDDGGRIAFKLGFGF